MMNVFITGSDSGQLHWELLRTCPTSINIVGVTPRLDLLDSDAIAGTVHELAPDVIINAAAYTAVDKAESEPEKAYALNAIAVEHLATATRKLNARLIHVSTDFVFGQSNGAPFAIDASTDPVSVYGKTKLAAEQVVTRLLPAHSVIFRTAWVYSSHGNNFVKTMLRLMNTRGEVGVIADQVGSPTWAHSLAMAIWQSIAVNANGMLHWTGVGVASWYDFAVAIAEEASELGLIERDVSVQPLTTEQYPTPACRPNYSVLQLHDSWKALDLHPPQWRCDLREMLKELT